MWPTAWPTNTTHANNIPTKNTHISSKFGLPYLQVANRSVGDREHEENGARDSEDAADHFDSKTWLSDKEKSARSEDAGCKVVFRDAVAD